MSGDLRARLAHEIRRVDWTPLGPHAQRGGMILVDPQLDLLEVAVAVARDDSERVGRWMRERQLRKPTEAQIEIWQNETGERFTIAIVQPYVLAQREPSRP